MIDTIAMCDWEREEANLGRWRIIKRCNRGYDPFYTLHKRRSFFGFKWWSNTIKFADSKETLIEFANKWNLFPGYCYDD